jgi:hypothetical protein
MFKNADKSLKKIKNLLGHIYFRAAAITRPVYKS